MRLLIIVAATLGLIGLALSSCTSTADRIGTTVSAADWQDLQTIEGLILDAELNLDETPLVSADKLIQQLRTKDLLNPEARQILTGLSAWRSWLAGDDRQFEADAAFLRSKAADSEWASLATGLQLLGQKKSAQAEALWQKNLETLDKAPRLRFRLALVAAKSFDTAKVLGYLDAAILDYPPALSAHLTGYRRSAIDSARLAIQTAAGSAIQRKSVVNYREMLLVILGETRLPGLFGLGSDDQPTKLFQALVSTKLLSPPPSDLNTPVVRSDYALLSFRILAQFGSDPGLARRYQDWLKALASGHRDPALIPDLPTDRQSYFPAKTLIEREILSLPDGKNFYPDLALSGVELLGSLRMIERELASKLRNLSD